jgi:beta-lactamase superfamily II metal-dependent hydrolase
MFSDGVRRVMKIWFLNVGHGDCTVIEHPSGRLTMVDINNSQDYDPQSRANLTEELRAEYGLAGEFLIEQAEARELDCPITFFTSMFPGRSLFRFVLTHPDLDHMRGLKNLFDQVQVCNFWDTANTKPMPQFRSDGDREDWNFYQKLRSGGVPAVSVRCYTRGADRWAFNRNDDGTPGGDGIYVLSPTPTLVADCNERGVSNDLSVTLMIKYAGQSIILPGDAEGAAWDDMVAVYGSALKATVLKASHHGRDSGFHLDSLKVINPDFVISSVGRKPSTDAHQKYSYHCENVYSTRHYGRISLEISAVGALTWQAMRNAA